MDVSFDYPEGWEVLFDSMDIHADVVLCPPEKERIETRYRFANCLTFIAGDELLGPPNPFEGDNAVYSYFTEDVKNSSGKNYNDFRVWRSSSSKPDAILVGLYRDGLNDKLGIWQALCAKDKLPECSDIFRHVLHSLHFEH